MNSWIRYFPYFSCLSELSIFLFFLRFPFHSFYWEFEASQFNHYEWLGNWNNYNWNSSWIGKFDVLFQRNTFLPLRFSLGLLSVNKLQRIKWHPIIDSRSKEVYFSSLYIESSLVMLACGSLLRRLLTASLTSREFI